MEHPVQLGVGPDVLERGRGRIGVDSQQLDLIARLAQHCLGVQHRRGGQRADRRALRVVEGQDHHLAAEGVKRGGLAELVRQREIGRRAGHRRARIQIRILRLRVGLGLTRPAGSHDDDRDRGQRDQQQRGARKRQQPAVETQTRSQATRDAGAQPRMPANRPVHGQDDADERHQRQRDDAQRVVGAVA